VIFPADTKRPAVRRAFPGQVPTVISAANPPHVPGRHRVASRGSLGPRRRREQALPPQLADAASDFALDESSGRPISISIEDRFSGRPSRCDPT